MPPDDPLGRHGPSLDNFLRKKPVVPEHKKQQCPYGKKCLLNVRTEVSASVIHAFTKTQLLIPCSAFLCREEMHLWN